MDPVGKWAEFRGDAASQILAFSIPNRVSTRASIAKSAKNAGNFRGTTFNINRKKNATLGSELNGKVFMITHATPTSVEIFIPYLVNGTTPNGGGTSTIIDRNLVELTDPPSWANKFENDERGVTPQFIQDGGSRRKTKSKSRKAKSKKSKSKKSRKSKKSKTN